MTGYIIKQTSPLPLERERCKSRLSSGGMSSPTLTSTIIVVAQAKDLNGPPTPLVKEIRPSTTSSAYKDIEGESSASRAWT